MFLVSYTKDSKSMDAVIEATNKKEQRIMAKKQLNLLDNQILGIRKK